MAKDASIGLDSWALASGDVTLASWWLSGGPWRNLNGGAYDTTKNEIALTQSFYNSDDWKSASSGRFATRKRTLKVLS